MEGRPPVSNAGEDVSAVHKKRAPCRLNSPARISRSSGFFVPQSPSESVLTVDQAPNTKARRAVAVQLPQASPRTLDGYVEIEGSDTVLNVLREAQGESGLRFQERFGGGHTEVVSTSDFAVNTSQGDKCCYPSSRVWVSHSLQDQRVDQITKS